MTGSNLALSCQESFEALCIALDNGFHDLRVTRQIRSLGEGKLKPHSEKDCGEYENQRRVFGAEGEKGRSRESRRYDDSQEEPDFSAKLRDEPLRGSVHLDGGLPDDVDLSSGKPEVEAG